MNKICDGIIGLAIGDAIGVPVEFRSRQELTKAPVVSMREYGTHYQPRGTWSDDTSLTLALMDSIIEKNEIDYVDIMNRFSNWLLYNDYTATGEVFDVGNSTSRAIAECVLKAVNLGDDTDTVGAVVGGLAGIYYGLEKIPKDWLDVLARRQYIEELCEELLKAINF